MIVGLLLLAGAAERAMEPLPERYPARYDALTRAEVPCTVSDDPDEIVVCGGRDADRYRVPLIPIPEAGDPRAEGVFEERTRYFARTTPLQDMGPFQVGGGSAGVSVSTRSGVSVGRQRPLAP